MHLILDNLKCERDERVLFSSLSATFSSGDIVQVVGANGAGKTTLLRILCGLSSLYSGAVRWGEETNQSYNFRSSLLYLGHTPALNSSLSALENLRWFFGLCGLQAEGTAPLSVGDAEIKAALAKTGMRGYEDVPCRMLSAGQQRRVSLARIYCSHAPLWVLDEPFTAIDKQGVADLEQRFVEHAKHGGIVLLTSHQNLAISGLKVLDLADCTPSAA